MKKLISLVSAACALLAAPALHAGQPVVWSLSISNASLTTQAVGATGSNNVTADAVWTSAGFPSSPAQYAVDTLQSSFATIGAAFNATANGQMSGATGAAQPNSFTTYWVGSHDLINWTPWTNVVSAALPGSTNQFAGYLALDTKPFRYIACSTIVWTATNCWVTNNAANSYTNAPFGQITSASGIQIKVQLKGP